MPLEAGMPAVTVNQLSADQWRPLSRVTQLDRTAFLAQLQQIRQFTVPAVDGPAAGDGPGLDVAPTSVDSFWTTSQDPTQYFVPAVEIARRSPTSAVPAVYVDRVAGAWSLRVVLNFRRHPNFDQSEGTPLQVHDLSVRLYVPLEGGGDDSLTFTDLTDEPPVEPGVLRKLVARAPVTKLWIDRMKTVTGTVLLVTGIPRFTRSAALVQQIATQGWGGESTVMLTVEPNGAGLFMPSDVSQFAPIYAQFDGTEGGKWMVGPGGAWQPAPVLNQFYALPTEYRLAFDVEHSQPAVTVLLLEPAAATADQPAAAYRVRIRF